MDPTSSIRVDPDAAEGADCGGHHLRQQPQKGGVVVYFLPAHHARLACCAAQADALQRVAAQGGGAEAKAHITGFHWRGERRGTAESQGAEAALLPPPPAALAVRAVGIGLAAVEVVWPLCHDRRRPSGGAAAPMHGLQSCIMSPWVCLTILHVCVQSK